MRRTLKLAGLVLASALGACAALGADSPLFGVADQAGAPPLVEGLWVGGAEECPLDRVATMARFPAECTPLEVRRDPDGAWLFVHRLDLADGLSEEDRLWMEEHPGPLRMIIVPAVNRAIPPDAYAPLYLAEIDDEDDAGTRVEYLVLAPHGTMPATALEAFLSISCEDALRDGPIAGITALYDEAIAPDGSRVENMRSCTATTQASVREAVRRAIIEDTPTRQHQTRFVFVRAN